MGAYLTSQDVAERLQVSRETVRRWLRTKELRGMPLGRAGYRIEEADFQAFIQQRCESTPHHASNGNGSNGHHIAGKRAFQQNVQNISPLVCMNKDSFPHQDALNRQIIESSADCIKVLDLQGNLLYMNVGGQQSMEIDDFSLCLNMPWTDFWQGNDQQSAQNALVKAREGKVSAFRGYCETAKGTPKWWEVVVTPVFDTNGNVERILSVSHDITERIRMEAALRESNQRLTLAQETAQLGIWDLDFATGALDCTAMCKANFGLPPETIFTYDKLIKMIHADDRDSMQQAVRRALDEHTKYEAEYRALWPDGSAHWILASGRGIYGDDGKPVGMTGITLEITERKEREQRKDDFIGMASHELRTPLSTMKGSIQLSQRLLKRLLKQEELSPGASKIINDISGMLERALRQAGVQNRLISDLLDVSRIQANKLELSPVLCDPVTIVRETVEDQQRVTPTRPISLDLPEQDTVLVMADKDRIGQVVNNYLSNAIKYSEADQPITVGLRIEGQYVRIWVQDVGPGLSPEAQRHVWERFYQVEDVMVQYGSGAGLGLGLHISQTLIKRHHGQVGVESTLGKGSTFWFTLPLAM